MSPQAWGKMFVSKHHYAVELAKRGNKVYFLNPPDQKRKEQIDIEPSGLHDNLFFIYHRLNFSYNLKFRALPVFHWLIKFHIQKIVRRINEPLSIIWSFDLGSLYPFRFFGNTSYKVFHPVDEPLLKIAIDSAKGADIIFSVTREILDKYKIYSAPKHFINHGVSTEFLGSTKTNDVVMDGSIRVGFSGNLLRGDIDRDTLLDIIHQNQTIIFEFWGSHSVKDANIGGGVDTPTINFIEALKKYPNVKLHGAVSSRQLASAIMDMHAFLICYDIKKDQSKGTNYHKVMEYLSTGKVIISNNITTYSNRPDLVQMIAERENNNLLPALFKDVVANLFEFNSPEKQQVRMNFAAENSYSKQIDRIEEKIEAEMKR
ncbi:MAG TPA: hypothetical protein VL443_28510 [Cyclobacteriaceae bacterium]|nr:hypothetical protein [Cyclobacteriaceae bacterium]